MLAFDVAVNGTRHCLAGVGTRGILSAFVTYYRVPPDDDLPDLGRAVHLHVSGTRGDGTRVQWPRGSAADPTVRLAPGDVVTIRVVEADAADPGRPAL